MDIQLLPCTIAHTHLQQYDILTIFLMNERERERTRERERERIDLLVSIHYLLRYVQLSINVFMFPDWKENIYLYEEK